MKNVKNEKYALAVKLSRGKLWFLAVNLGSDHIVSVEEARAIKMDQALDIVAYSEGKYGVTGVLCLSEYGHTYYADDSEIISVILLR